MTIIMSPEEAKDNKDKAVKTIQDGDLLNGVKFNALPGPVTARMCGGGEWWIETLDVQTGAMRLDVCGQIDLSHFSEVMILIDINGSTHDPEDFWLDP